MSYRFKPETLVDTFKAYKGMDGDDIVENRVKTVLKSRISEITTEYSLMDLYSGNRSEINDRITKYLNEKFSKQFGIEVIDASIIDVHPDKQLRTSINKRITAQQEADQAKAEQKKAKVEAETALIKAQSAAKVKLTKAEAEAKANKVISDSLTKELIEQNKIEKWDGKMPKVSGDAGTIVKVD
jgi:regulator of protease activity HflC (stomatin/prohibitin superfamily)